MPKNKSKAVTQMHRDSAIITALLGGTKAMREAGITYLPKHAKETDDDYQVRQKTAVLKEIFGETIRQMVGRVFFKPIQTTKVNEQLKTWLPNIDLQNNDMNIFAANWFKDALAYGASYVLVDYPTAPSNNLADAKQHGLRPYFVLIKNTDVIGFKSDLINGVPVCTQFRYRQTLLVEDGEFGEQEIEQITVWDIGRIRHYRYNDKHELVLHREIIPLGANGQPLDFVPVVDLVLEPTAFFTGKIPMLNLAYLNVKHWQMYSDYHNIIRFTSIPLLSYSGTERFGEAQDATIASNNLFDLGLDGKMGYVEHSGAAIGSSVTALEKLEEDMMSEGAKLLTRTKLALTDSQAKDEQGKEISKLRLYANKMEDAIGRALDFQAKWLGIENGGTVEISGNIDADFDPSASFADVLKMHSLGVLSNQTVFEEAQSRNIVSPLREWADEQARLELQDTLGVRMEQ